MNLKFTMANPINFNQPLVFPLSVTTVLFEHFGFYILSFAFVLFIKDVFNLSDEKAFAINGVFTALVYLTPAIGGYLADNVVGIRRTIVLGLCLEALGLILLSLPPAYTFYNDSIYSALALIVIGVGFFRVGPTHLMGRSYTKNDPRVDSGFTMYYMIKNIGAFFAPIAVGGLHKYFSWNFAFFCGGISLFFGLLSYYILRHRAAEVDSDVGKIPLSAKKLSILTIGILFGFATARFLLINTHFANALLFIISVLIFIYFLYEIIKSNKAEQLAIIVCLILIFIGMAFFVMFFQIFSSIILFIARCVFKPAIFGHQILTTDLLALGAFWVIILGPILISVYGYLSKRDKDLSITHKFSLGLFVIALCFLTLALSTLYHNEQWKVSWWWIVLTLMLSSLGELFVSALGVAMITKIAPKRMYGIMMGAWFLIATSFAAVLSSKVANLASIPNSVTDFETILNIYGLAYFKVGMVGLSIALAVFIASKYIKKFIVKACPYEAIG